MLIVEYYAGEVDGAQYWGDIEQRHAQHRRHVGNLLVAVAVIVLLAVLIDRDLAVIAVLIGPLLWLEVCMVRRTRPRVAIPDHRPTPAVEIDLDEH